MARRHISPLSTAFAKTSLARSNAAKSGNTPPQRLAMIDPFEKHGLSHLSPSSLRLWRAEPAAWISRYLLRVRDDIGPAAWRGTAVEAGVDMLLFGNSPELAVTAMRTQWDFLAQGLVDPDAEKES